MLFRQALDSHSLIHTTPKAPHYKHATFRWPSGGMTRRSTQRVHPVFREFSRGISPRVKVTKIDEITKIKSGQSHAWYSPAITSRPAVVRLRAVLNTTLVSDAVFNINRTKLFLKYDDRPVHWLIRS